MSYQTLEVRFTERQVDLLIRSLAGVHLKEDAALRPDAMRLLAIAKQRLEAARLDGTSTHPQD